MLTKTFFHLSSSQKIGEHLLLDTRQKEFMKVQSVAHRAQLMSTILQGIHLMTFKGILSHWRNPKMFAPWRLQHNISRQPLLLVYEERKWVLQFLFFHIVQIIKFFVLHPNSYLPFSLPELWSLAVCFTADK
jgi:hypothetical protein